jgi:Flp pilus assembly protein TadB
MSDTPKPETPITAQVVDETTNQQATTSEQTSSNQTTNESTHTQHKKDAFSSTLDDMFKSLKDAFKKLNERHLVLKNKAGSSVFRLPLVWAIVLGLVSFVIQIVPIVVIAVIVALVTKHQFVIEHNVQTPSV